MQQTLLALFAHPDDEAFGTGGTLSQYAAAGVDVTLVCTTRGEVGEIAEGTGATPETLGEVREAELRCAAETVGVRELIFLGYRDSGMAGTPENADPWAYVNAAADEVVPQLVGIIRRVRPQVVITFEPNGGYGHPDHIAIHHHTVAAFHAAANGRAIPSRGRPGRRAPVLHRHSRARSFCGCGTRWPRWGWIPEDSPVSKRRGRRLARRPGERDARCGRHGRRQWSALECHRTQFGPGNRFRRLPDAVLKRVLSREYFALPPPEPAPGARFNPPV